MRGAGQVAGHLRQLRRAKLFGVAPCTIYEGVRLGTLEAQGIETYRLGKNAIRFSKEEVHAALVVQRDLAQEVSCKRCRVRLRWEPAAA